MPPQSVFDSDEPVFAVRVVFIRPDASALLRRRGRRGGLVTDGSQPLAVLSDTSNQHAEYAAKSASTGFSREKMKAMAKSRARLVLVEPDFGDPVHMEKEFTAALADRELAEMRTMDSSDSDDSSDESGSEAQASTDSSDDDSDPVKDDDTTAMRDNRRLGDEQDPRFLPSSTFVGARPGYFFGTGPLGLGYHYDDTSSHWVEAEAQSAVDEATASLAEWLQERVVLLQALSPAELRQVAAATETREYPNGHAIVTEGQEGTEMFVVQKGSAAVTKIGVNAGRPLATYGPGDAFGERALLLTEPRSATVKATSPFPNMTVCLVIGQAVASKLLLNNPTVQTAMRKRAAMHAAAEKASRELVAAEARTLQASVFVQLLDGALTQRLVGDRGVAFGVAARGRDYVPLQRLEEEQAALDLHNQHQQPQRAGEVWYVVSSEWWHRWVDHVNFWQHYEQPGPIDNEPLLSPSEDGDHADQTTSQRRSSLTERFLRRDPMLKESEDYVVTCKDVWDCLMSWYGGGPAIERQSVYESQVLSMTTDSVNKTLQLSTTFAPSTFVVEVYPMRLRICLRSQIPPAKPARVTVSDQISATEDDEDSRSVATIGSDTTATNLRPDDHDAASVKSENTASSSATRRGQMAERRALPKRARVVVAYDPPGGGQEQGKLALDVGDEIEVTDSSGDFWHGRKLPSRNPAEAAGEMADGAGGLSDSWQLWSEDSLEHGRFPSTCVELIAESMHGDGDSEDGSGADFGTVIEVTRNTQLGALKQQACALLGIEPLLLPPSARTSSGDAQDRAQHSGFDRVKMRAFSRALGFTPTLDDSLTVTDARLFDGAVVCLDEDRPITAAKPVGVASVDASAALGGGALSEGAETVPPEAVPPSRAGLPATIAARRPPSAPLLPAELAESHVEDGSTADVELHWREATQRGFKAVLGPLFDARTGVAVMPMLAEDTAPAEGSVEKVEQLVAQKLRDLEAEKRQSAAAEDFDRALSCKRALADWQLRQTVWVALGKRGAQSVELVSDLVDEIEGRAVEPAAAGQVDDDVNAAERARRGGSRQRRGAVVEVTALQAAGAASVASQTDRIRLTKLRMGWPMEALNTIGGMEELLQSAASLDTEDRPLQRAWLRLKQSREAAEREHEKAEALAAVEEERRRAKQELERIDAEEEAAAGPLPAGWEKVRRGRTVLYIHAASGRQQPDRPHAIDALTAVGPSRRPAVEAAALQSKAGQALLSGDGALALRCLQAAATLVPDDPAVQSALARLEMLAPPPPLPEGWSEEDDSEEDMSDDSEEDEWQQWVLKQQEQAAEAGAGAAGSADEAREQQQRRQAHKLLHRARKWLEAALGPGRTLRAEAAAAGTASSSATEGSGGSGPSFVFGAALRSGVLLCETVNQIKPGLIKKISRSAMPFPQRENISSFIAAARSLGVAESDSFDTADLFELRNLPQVATCVLALARVVAEPPHNFHPFVIAAAAEAETTEIPDAGAAPPGMTQAAAAAAAAVRNSGGGDVAGGGGRGGESAQEGGGESSRDSIFIRGEWEQLEDVVGGQGRYFHHKPSGRVSWEPPPGW